jgi:hypothetical protein
MADIVRPAGTFDLDAMTRIVADAYTKYIDRVGKSPSPMLDDYSVHIRNHTAWVIECDGTVAGHMCFCQKTIIFYLITSQLTPRATGVASDGP